MEEKGRKPEAEYARRRRAAENYRKRLRALGVSITDAANWSGLSHDSLTKQLNVNKPHVIPRYAWRFLAALEKDKETVKRIFQNITPEDEAGLTLERKQHDSECAN